MRREARRGFQARAKNASAEDDEADEEKLRKELGELGPQLRRAHAKSRNLEREGAALESELKRRQIAVNEMEARISRLKEVL